jgi:hypothetical protein
MLKQKSITPTFSKKGSNFESGSVMSGSLSSKMEHR